MKSIFKIVITFILSVLLWNVILAPTLENIKLGQTTALNVVSGVVAEKIRSSSKKELPSTPLAQNREDQKELIYMPISEKSALSNSIKVEKDKDDVTLLRFTTENSYEEVLRYLAHLHEGRVNLHIDGIKTKEDQEKYMDGLQEAWKNNKAYLDPRESWSGMKWSYIDIQPYKIYLEMDFVLTADELAYLDKIFQEKAEYIRSKTSDPVKQAEFAYQTTVKDIQYDDSSAGVKLGVQESWVPRNAYTACKTGTVVCSGYVDYYNGILDALEIGNLSVEGVYKNNKGESIPHAWTEVKAQDKYFYSDPTFGDGYRNSDVVWEWFSFTELKDRVEDER